MRYLILILFLVPGGPAFSQTPEDGFCIANASDAPMVFVTETREGARKVEDVAPGGVLCSHATSAPDGVIGVFQSRDVFEGCSRIIARGGREDLIAYAEFDRCEWSSHRS